MSERGERERERVSEKERGREFLVPSIQEDTTVAPPAPVKRSRCQSYLAMLAPASGRISGIGRISVSRKDNLRPRVQNHLICDVMAADTRLRAAGTPGALQMLSFLLVFF